VHARTWRCGALPDRYHVAGTRADTGEVVRVGADDAPVHVLQERFGDTQQQAGAPGWMLRHARSRGHGTWGSRHWVGQAVRVRLAAYLFLAGGVILPQIVLSLVT
jgi:hypothetical protein